MYLPIIGYGNNVVNTLRIWDAEPINTFNLDSFDRGDYQKAVEQENLAKTIVEAFTPMTTTTQARNCAEAAVFFIPPAYRGG